MEYFLLQVRDLTKSHTEEIISGVLSGVLSDFTNECKDQKTIEILAGIIDVWIETGKSVTHSPSIAELPIFDPPLNKQEEKKIEPPTLKGNPGKCPVLMKSGPRKDQPCDRLLKGQNQVCTQHLPKLNTGIKCEAVMKAGVRKGQLCGKNVAPGDIFCGTHKHTKCIYKLTLPGTSKESKCGRPISRCSTSESYCRIHLPFEMHIDKSKFVLTQNKFGSKEHKYSELIFEDKKVIGKQKLDGGTLTMLSDDDYECIRVYGLPLSDNLIEGMHDYIKRRPLIFND